jgi:hypothetical protein
MFGKRPAFSSWDASGGHRGFDFSPKAMGWETNHGIPNPGTGAIALAGGAEYVAGQIAIRRPAGVRRGKEAVRSRHSPIFSAH